MTKIIYSIMWVCKRCASVCGTTDRTVPSNTGCESGNSRTGYLHDWIPVNAEVIK